MAEVLSDTYMDEQRGMCVKCLSCLQNFEESVHEKIHRRNLALVAQQINKIQVV